MCGIFGYIGNQNPVKVVLNGLRRLEYRGYDSAGIAGIQNGKMVYCKEVGKLSILEKQVENSHLDLEIAIGHTRWATHGIPTILNAHPQFDTNHTVAVVHNGIIENHETLRNSLKQQGVHFISDTDTEVVAHLIASFYNGDLLKAVLQAVSLLHGAFALGILHKDHPDQLIAVANAAPLVIGIGNNEVFLSSDPQAFVTHTRDVIYLINSEIAVIKANKVEVFNLKMEQVDKTLKQLELHADEVNKGDFEHYTLKEIYQQPQAIRNACASRFLEDYGTATFEDLFFNINEIAPIERIQILACGTSYHAGLVGAYMLEDKARIPTQVEIASEFRYKNPIVLPGTFVIAVSQSGETADTIAAVREVKAKKARILSICNSFGSTLARESDGCIFLRAGAEIGVCSTKAFTSQVTVFALLTLMLARMKDMTKQEGQQFLNALQHIPEQVEQVLALSPQIKALAKKYAHYENFFFIGRRYMYPASLEGALKLKEISYINANGYAAGEIKHGPIALLNQNCPVIALCNNRATFQKMESNLREVKARNAPLLAIIQEGMENVENIADDVIYTPRTIDELATIPTTVVTQLLSYYIAKELGADIDQPRNLAKSVTVE